MKRTSTSHHYNPQYLLDPTTTTSSSDKEDDHRVYKVPEYYQYNEHSYYDIDEDMLKYRLEQPHPGGKY